MSFRDPRVLPAWPQAGKEDPEHAVERTKPELCQKVGDGDIRRRVWLA